MHHDSNLRSECEQFRKKIHTSDDETNTTNKVDSECPVGQISWGVFALDEDSVLDGQIAKAPYANCEHPTQMGKVAALATVCPAVKLTMNATGMSEIFLKGTQALAQRVQRS
jgi:hypothetical protein